MTEAGLDRVIDYRHADCSRKLPFARDSIDIVVNIESACHYADRGQFLREAHRILKPGGRVVAMDRLMSDDITARKRETFIEPMFENWAVTGLESLSGYSGRSRDANLTVLEYTGFNGKDFGNPRPVEKYSRTLRGLHFLGHLPSRYRPMMERSPIAGMGVASQVLRTRAQSRDQARRQLTA